MIRFICKKYFNDILLLLLESPKSFNELLRILKAYPDTLNNRLKELLKFDLIVSREDSDGKIRYRLTDRGTKVAEEVKKIEKILKKIEELLEG